MSNHSSSIANTGGGWLIEIEFTPEGREKVARITKERLNKALGIVVLDKLLAAPRIMEPITGGKVMVTGDFSEEEARSLLDWIAAGLRKNKEEEENSPFAEDDFENAEFIDKDLWIVEGRVVDAEGNPMEGVRIASLWDGGTLRPMGETKTGKDGRYRLQFGSGIYFTEDKSIRGAVISATLPGHYEEKLNRGGESVVTLSKPKLNDELRNTWGERIESRLFLPEKPLEIDFVMRPAAAVEVALDSESPSLLPDKFQLYLTGDTLPPGRSALDSKTYSHQGIQEFTEVPLGIPFVFKVSGEGDRQGAGDPRPPVSTAGRASGIITADPGTFAGAKSGTPSRCD